MARAETAHSRDAIADFTGNWGWAARLTGAICRDRTTGLPRPDAAASLLPLFGAPAVIEVTQIGNAVFADGVFLGLPFSLRGFVVGIFFIGFVVTGDAITPGVGNVHPPRAGPRHPSAKRSRKPNGSAICTRGP